MSEEKQKALETAGSRVGDTETFVSGCGACVVVGHNAPDGILPEAPIYRRQPRPEGCEDCSGCPDCYTNEKPCDCATVPQDFDATVKLTEADPVAAEAIRRRDGELAKLIEQSRQLGPMTSEERREQRISWVYGNCKLSNPEVTREMVENAVDFGASTTMTICPASAYADAVVTVPIATSSSPSATPAAYNNPLAALRRERKVKSGKAAKLLGISRQRLHIVEHSSKSLPCMARLLAKAAVVWPVGDETTTTVVVSK